MAVNNSACWGIDDVMNILITGGAGFLGVVLAQTLLERGEVAGQPITRLTLLDRATPPDFLLDDPRVNSITGDLVDLLQEGQAVPLESNLVFHLAAAVSADCEQDFELGMRSNLLATQLLLEACRAQSRTASVPVRLVFASSVAVFGGALPDIVQDDTLPQPQSSYGIQKFICEQLVADYARKGFVDGRSVRLMSVSVRPGLPNGAASGFLSGIVREPLAGKRAVCPVSAATGVALSTPRTTVAGLIKAGEASAEIWGSRSAMNLPALTVRIADMVAALGRIAGPDVASFIDWRPDPSIERIVGGWPSRIAATRAVAMGLHPDGSFEDVVQAYIQSTAGPNSLRMK